MMHSIYNFVSGPLVWASFLVCIIGTLYRVAGLLVLAYRKEAFIFSFMSLKYSLLSIFHWIIPFASVNMRRHPVLTVVTFLFHISLLLAPLLLLSHIVLWDEAWNISWWALPDHVADMMTVVVILSCLFFLCRRLFLKEVKFVTSPNDYLLLLVVAAPFATGFWAYHQFPGYVVALILHILSGEILLVAIPFTRLSHMIFAVFTRAYMGSEFGGIRHARDW